MNFLCVQLDGICLIRTDIRLWNHKICELFPETLSGFWCPVRQVSWRFFNSSHSFTSAALEPPSFTLKYINLDNQCVKNDLSLSTLEGRRLSGDTPCFLPSQGENSKITTEALKCIRAGFCVRQRSGNVFPTISNI